MTFHAPYQLDTIECTWIYIFHCLSLTQIDEYIRSENSDPNTQPKARKPDPPKSIVQLKRITQRKQEPPLPKPFPLPQNVPPAVALALEAKSLTGKTRAKFVTALANSVFMHKSYPTSRELEDVVRAAIRKWEFLGTKSGCVSSSA